MQHVSPSPLSFKDVMTGKADVFFLSGVLFCFVAAYAPVLKALVHSWSTSDNYSHGFFIVPISLFILWQKRDQLARVEIFPANWGLGLIIASLAIYFLASLAGIQTLAALPIVPLWAGIILYLFGWRMLREVMFPLCFLFFMIPIPSQLYSLMTIPLQLMVSKISVMLTSGIGIPVFSEGNVLHLPDRTLEVVEACSGLRSLLSLFVLSLVFGYFSLQSNWLRTILFVSAVPIALCVNVVRVSLIIISFYFFGFDLTSGAVHTYLGIAVFLLAMALIFAEKGILSHWNQISDAE